MTRTAPARLLGASVLAVSLPALVAVAAPTSASAAPPTTPTVTVTTLTSKDGASVQAGNKLRLLVRVSPKASGKVTISDGGSVVDTVKVVDGKAKLVLTSTRGAHSYTAKFAPKGKDYAPSVSTGLAVTGAAATSLPLRPGAYGSKVAKAQQRLTWSGILVKDSGRYKQSTVDAVTRFQGKFGLAQTGVVNKATDAMLKKLKLKKLPSSCTSVALSICVDKTRKVAQLVENGKVTISLDARFGSVNTPGLATREGIFSIQRKAVVHMSTEFHTSMPYSMFFSGGQAVHYSQYFAADGYSGASHGCVNIRDLAGIKKMYAKAPLGTRVVIYRS